MTWDVTVTDTYARSYIALTKVRTGAAAERAALNKTNKYNYLLSKYIFIPLACKISGVWCVEGIDFLNELGRRTSLVTGDKNETHYLFQRLSVAIQRSNAAGFCGCFLIVDICDD